MSCINKCFYADLKEIVDRRAEQLSENVDVKPWHYISAIRDLVDKLNELYEETPERFEGRYRVDIRHYEVSSKKEE